MSKTYKMNSLLEMQMHRMRFLVNKKNLMVDKISLSNLSIKLKIYIHFRIYSIKNQTKMNTFKLVVLDITKKITRFGKRVELLTLTTLWNWIWLIYQILLYQQNGDPLIHNLGKLILLVNVKITYLMDWCALFGKNKTI